MNRSTCWSSVSSVEKSYNWLFRTRRRPWWKESILAKPEPFYAQRRRPSSPMDAELEIVASRRVECIHISLWDPTRSLAIMILIMKSSSLRISRSSGSMLYLVMTRWRSWSGYQASPTLVNLVAMESAVETVQVIHRWNPFWKRPGLRS